MKLQDFNYSLPPDLIAQHPSPKRDEARLMVIDRRSQTIRHDIFRNLNAYLPKRSALVVNNSKVVPARLLGKKERTGGDVEVFLLKKIDDHCYEALLRPLKKIREQELLVFPGGVTAFLADKDKRIVQFSKKNVEAHLSKIGHIPLPPYITRDDTPADHADYQTVYAKTAGSVASPTAGLHFTKKLLSGLKKSGHDLHSLTLHINYGTFKPVEAQDIKSHPMHWEEYAIAKSTFQRIDEAKKSGRQIVAVGTTSCRVLESVAAGGKLKGSTNLFIYPGFSFRMVDCLITNFHLPLSTLLMLVYAFGGMDLMKRAYGEAIKERYRFYSYGDAMIII